MNWIAYIMGFIIAYPFGTLFAIWLFNLIDDWVDERAEKRRKDEIEKNLLRFRPGDKVRLHRTGLEMKVRGPREWYPWMLECFWKDGEDVHEAAFWPHELDLVRRTSETIL